MTDCFLITRFNLALFCKDKENNPVRNKEWLDDRFRLFETYCIPSIQKQTYKDFIWIVLFSTQTPDEYKLRIEKLCKKVPQLMVLYINDNETDTYHDQVKEKIRELKDDSPLLVTIRIDNDDAIRLDYIEKALTLAAMQKEYKAGYSFVYGIQYHVNANIAMRVPYPNNHFILEINKEYDPANFDYILEYNHANIQDMPFPFKYITDKEIMWAEVIHGRNVDNDVKGTWHQKPVWKPSTMLTEYFGWEHTLSFINTLIKIPTHLMPAALHHAYIRIKQKLR